MSPIYQALGITAGFIQSDMDPVARRKAYDCDITYGTNSEFGFDYLRDNMKPARWGDAEFDPHYQQCQKALNYAIIDEVDNILIDEARTPLIISGQAFGDVRRYAKANDIAVQLADLQKSEPDKYFEVKEKEHTCHLTDEGIRKAEELAGVESFYTAGNMEWPHLIDNALKAHHLYKKDKQYAVMRHPESSEMSIIIIDEFTGRLMIGRQWSDGLHQAVEAKHAREGVKIKEETQTLATITLQNFFKLYKKLAGMTGTAMTEADEFWKIYKLEVIAIPTNKPLIRVNHPDVIYRTEKEKWKAVGRRGRRGPQGGPADPDRHDRRGQVAEAERAAQAPRHQARAAERPAGARGPRGGDRRPGRPHRRRDHRHQHGRPRHRHHPRRQPGDDGLGACSRTSTPRGSTCRRTSGSGLVDDIEQKEKMKEEGRKVAEMGGLHIVGTERHEARRIDNQLRGRAGRQGDPGSSRFYLSLEDDLMRIFAGEWVGRLLTRLGMEEGQAIESRMVSRRIAAAQKKVEERHFDSRKNLLEYDEVMDKQRKDVYGFRQRHPGRRQLQDPHPGHARQADRQLTSSASWTGTTGRSASRSSRRGGWAWTSTPPTSTAATTSRPTRRPATRRCGRSRRSVQEMHRREPRRRGRQGVELAGAGASGQHALGPQDERPRAEADRQGRPVGIPARAGAGRRSAAIDLTEGKDFLDEDWGRRAVCDWARLKFQIKLTPEELAGKSETQIDAS